MTRTIRCFLALSLLLFFSLPSAAQDNSKTSQMIQELTRKSDNIKSYKVDTALETSAMGQKITSKGTMLFKKPDMMRMTTTTDMMGGMKQEIYKSDDILWTYMPTMKMATKVDLAKIKSAFPGQEEVGQKDLSDMLKNYPKDAIKYVEKKTVDGKEVYVFELAPDKFQEMPQEGMPMAPEKIEMLVNADSGLPHGVVMYGKDGSVMMRQTYSNYQLNVPIPDSEFKFTPPKDAQVMDMTEGTINMMNQMKKGGMQSGEAPSE